MKFINFQLGGQMSASDPAVRAKSIEEIKVALGGLGLSLGMRIDPNLLGALDRGGTIQ